MPKPEPAGSWSAPGGRQRIPRPASARPGRRPRWSGGEATVQVPVSMARVRSAMARLGPAQAWPVPSAGVPAAVLVALFEEDGDVRVILTRRSSRLRSHTSEVAFPGGRVDPGEAPLAAALREAGEEVGLDPASVEILGQLPALSTFSSRSSITPFVGVLPSRPQLHPNPEEVERAFDVSLSDLVSEDVYREELWASEAQDERAIHFFELEHDTVWGATARILHHFLELVLLSPG